MRGERQILACSGVIYPAEGSPPEMVGAQVRQAMALARARLPKVRLIPTATGDSQAHLDRWTKPRSGSAPRTCPTWCCSLSPMCPMCAPICWPRM